MLKLLFLHLIIISIFSTACTKDSGKKEESKNEVADNEIIGPKFLSQQFDLKEEEAKEFKIVATEGKYIVDVAPKNGTLSNCLNPGSGQYCLYTPNKNFFGEDYFTYRRTDNVRAEVGKVLFIIENVNDVPEPGKDQVIAIKPGSANVITFSKGIDFDQDELSYLINPPTNGAIENCSMGENQIFSCEYKPNLNFIGTDKITYRVADQTTKSEKLATINLVIGKAIDIDNDFIPDYADSNPTMGSFPQLQITIDPLIQGILNLKNPSGEMEFFNWGLKELPEITTLTNTFKDSYIAKAAQFYKANQVFKINEIPFSIAETSFSPVLGPQTLTIERMRLNKIIQSRSLEGVTGSLQMTLHLDVPEEDKLTELKDIELSFYLPDSRENLVEIGKTIIRKIRVGEVSEASVNLKDIPYELAKKVLLTGKLPIVKIKNFQILNEFAPNGVIDAIQLRQKLFESNVELILVHKDRIENRYIVPDNNKKTITDLMNKIYHDQFSIVNEEFSHIGDEKSSLPLSTYLSQIATNNERSWFSFSRNKKLGLKEQFSAGDHIVMLYLSGSELGTNLQINTSQYLSQISGSGALKSLEIAKKIPKHSRLYLTLEPLWRTGAEITEQKKNIAWEFCYQSCVPYACEINYEKLTPFKRPIDVSNEDYLNSIEIQANEKNYPLRSLVKENLTDESYHSLELDLSKIEGSKIESLNLILKGATTNRMVVWSSPQDHEVSCNYNHWQSQWVSDKVPPFIFWVRKTREDFQFINDLTTPINYQENDFFNLETHLESYRD